MVIESGSSQRLGNQYYNLYCSLSGAFYLPGWTTYGQCLIQNKSARINDFTLSHFRSRPHL